MFANSCSRTKYSSKKENKSGALGDKGSEDE